MLLYPCYRIIELCLKAILTYYNSYIPLSPQATVEPVLYADLSTTRAQGKAATGAATVDQHQVIYTTVDIKATKKRADQQPKAATLPANSPPPGELTEITHFFCD